MTDLASLAIKVDSTGVKAGERDLDRLTGAGKRAEGSAKSVGTAFSSLRNIFYTLGIGLAAKQFLEFADAAKKVESQLKLATRELGSFYQAQADVRRISTETRGELDATATLYANFIRNSQALGKGQTDAARATETFTKAMKISGATATETAGATRQFGQALASGVLRGDEFNSVMENAPRLAKLLADSLGKPVGALREMASEGQLTSDILYRALTDTKFTAGIDAEFREVPVTFGEAMQQVTNAATITFGAFDKGGQFSTMLSDFVLGGARDFADLEKAATDFGIETRAIIEGLYNAFDPFVSGGISAFNDLFDALGIHIADTHTQIAQLLGSLDSLLNIGPSIANVFGAGGRFDSRLRQNFEESSAASERASRGRMGEEFIANVSRRYDIMGNPIGGGLAGGTASGGKAAKKSDAEKAYEKAVEASQKYVEQLEIERVELGKTDAEVKMMAAERAAALAPTEALRKAILSSAQALADETVAYEGQVAVAKAFSDIAEKNRKIEEGRARASKDFIANTVEPLEQQVQMLSLTGSALAQAKLEYEKLHIVLEYGVEAWLRYSDAQQAVIDDMKKTEAVDAYTESIQRLTDSLAGLGNIGRTLGGVIGLLSGDIGGISGPMGELLNQTVTRKDANGDIISRKLGDELRDGLTDIFGEKFGQKMLDVLGGAGMGMVAGAAFFGQQSQTEQIGSALGGALGKVAGKAIGESIGGLAGKLGGPLGAIAGGILGGVLGGLFSKTPYGRVTLGAGGASDASGNSGASRRAAAKAGGSFDTALQEIAEAFGGEIGEFGNITLGVRHGDWRVNESGTSLKKKKGATDFDGDAEAAIAYAIQIAIERGAITGIRESTQMLLKSSDDLQRNLEKALSFENVFKELAQLKDPFGFGMDELTKEFDRLRKIFGEAGASAAEYADLEELLALKRADLIESEGRRAVDKLSERNSLEVQLLELMGRSEDALAAARLNELASLEASLQPLQAMVYQLQDARVIIDQFGPLADDLKAFKQELLGGAGGASGFATVQARFRETSALAKDGDAGALGNLRGTATEFLDAARANASSAIEYQRAVGEVLASVDSGIFAADSQIEYAQLQIDAVNNSANIIAGMREEMKVYQQQIVENTSYMARLWSRFEGDGLLIKTDTDTPLQVEVV
jgi:tape measure domain-containing protein